MLQVLYAAARYLLGFVFSTSALKFFAVGAIVLILASVADLALGLIDQSAPSSAGSLVASLPNDFLYYMDILEADVGIALCLGAWAARFAIRRIPIIG